MISNHEQKIITNIALAPHIDADEFNRIVIAALNKATSSGRMAPAQAVAILAIAQTQVILKLLQPVVQPVSELPRDLQKGNP